MNRILIPCAAVLGACGSPPFPSPAETVMRNSAPPRGADAEAGRMGIADRREPATAVEPAAAARGRQILSTAFVRVGPDGHLTVELRGGRVLVLRDVIMRRTDYCGIVVPGTKRHCDGYAEVAAARPGGGPTPGAPQPALPDPGENRALPR